MLGGIIGDIVGSRFEFDNIKTKDFELFGKGCSFTDDTVLTVATAKAILEACLNYQGENYADSPVLNAATARNILKKSFKFKDYYIEFGRKYAHPMGGYGSGFNSWLYGATNHEPYGSCGNGSAMRVSPVGWYTATIDTIIEDLREYPHPGIPRASHSVEQFAEDTAIVTHNHPEGIKGAQAVALAIHLARMDQGMIRRFSVEETLKDIEQTLRHRYGYDFSLSVSELQQRYSWRGIDGKGNGCTCQDSVPQAIRCVLEAKDFEDAIRNAVSIGGDSDTIACIAGSIAEAVFGIPHSMREKAMTYLTPEMRAIVQEFENRFGYNEIGTPLKYWNGYWHPAVTPRQISHLRPGEIFVFGSNIRGQHAGGAAAAAVRHFGAVWGQGVGLQGQSYAIPTMEGGVGYIKQFVDDFIKRFVVRKSEITEKTDHSKIPFFYVTPIGCGIAGFHPCAIAPLFRDCKDAFNVALPQCFLEYI